MGKIQEKVAEAWRIAFYFDLCVSAAILRRRSAKKIARVIPNEVPRFFFPAAVRRARDAERDLFFANR